MLAFKCGSAAATTAGKDLIVQGHISNCVNVSIDYFFFFFKK